MILNTLKNTTFNLILTNRWHQQSKNHKMDDPKLKKNFFYLFTILFEDPQLKTLFKLDLLDLPQLEELLLPGLDLVQELHDLRNASLHVGVTRHVAGRALTA